jgi:eukaryotic-like serine/threonine-protein kinase
MKTDEWQAIEEIFHAALDLPGAERQAYLARVCAGRGALRAEVESLLASFERETEFLDRPAFDLGLKVLETEVETRLTGQQIGCYRVLDKLGSGGMGEVYLAEDSRLNRRVALKFLSGALIGDQWAKKQLVKEAQAVAMLDHPNICPVYGFEEIGEHSFIVMQHIEGRTLSEMLRDNGVAEERVLPITRQIAGALATAHAHGIIHRDIKTGNIMVTAGGQVKVLDFGLAKIIKRPNVDDPHRPVSLVSRTGLVVGTIAYMSPEQLRAEKLDFRTDVFSLGTVFYELVAGRHPFLAESDAETISAILTKDPETIPKTKSRLAARAVPVIKKCLEKDREKRYQSAEDLLLELVAEPARGASNFRLTAGLRAVIALIALVLLTTFAVFFYRPATRVRALAVMPFVNKTGDARHDYLSAISETLISKIENSSQISVKPYTLVANYRDGEVDPLEVGRRLAVDAVLVGRVVRRGQQLALETRLINVYDGSELLSENGNLDETGTLGLQNDLSAKVISRLESPVALGPKKNEPVGFTQNPEANKYYLQGLDYWKKRDNENIQKARDAFYEAIRLDPQFAQAYAYLAHIYIVRPSVNYKAMNPTEARKLAQSYAEDAIRLEPNLSEAHAALGAIRQKYEWKWVEAENEYRRSIELDAESAQTYYWYSDLLSVTGRYDEALVQILKARDLDPFSPMMELQHGRILYYARRYREAEKALAEALARHPNFPPLKLILGLVYLQLGNPGEALRLFEAIYAADKKSYAATLGYAYGRLGRAGDAERILGELAEIEKKDEFLPAHERAIVYVGLGDRDNAFLWLEKAYREPFTGLPVLSVDPAYDDLRGDPRFQDLLMRMGLKDREPIAALPKSSIF